MRDASLSRCLKVICVGGWLSLIAALTAVAEEEPAPPETITAKSPDGTIELTVEVTGPLCYSIAVDGEEIICPSQLGLKLAGGTTLGQDVALLNSSQQSEDSTWDNHFGKRRVVRNHYRELSLMLSEKSVEDRSFQLIFRLFDDGVAFRYKLLSQPGLRDFVLEQELTEFTFPADYVCFAGEHEKGMRSSQEWEFQRQRLSDISADAVKGLPVLIETPSAWVAIGEADLLDWAGMWIAGAERAATTDDGDSDDAEEDRSADAEPEESGPVTLVTKLAPRFDGEGLVKGKAAHESSWRVLMIGREPGRLIESEIIRNLSTPSKLEDTSWIKPGMMAWDHWWSGDTIMDTATIKSYIQLAADMGWPYQLIDWQWYGEPNKPDADITTVIDALDMDEVRRFAAERNVRLWLWLHWTDVDRDDAYLKAFPLYEEWGIAGVKIDFMDRDDQEMVNWYEKITAAAAEHQLMVNFHGAFKTAGFDRTYPNQVTREGILGNEYNKWSTRVTPEHKLTLPFTRYLEGPGDFTPGGFLNRQPDEFETEVKPTQVQGTRAGELALFVCYDSPVCCVCDHPDQLRDQPGANFLKIVPTVWDETRVLSGAVGEHLVIARQSGNVWFLGAMTNSESRELEVPLGFLGIGRWKMRLWQDGADAAKNAGQLSVVERTVNAGDMLTLRLAPAGGGVARFERL
jgi:alpha-glucosidase